MKELPTQEKQLHMKYKAASADLEVCPWHVTQFFYVARLVNSFDSDVGCTNALAAAQAMRRSEQ